jgi:hypothetical protein
MLLKNCVDRRRERGVLNSIVEKLMLWPSPSTTPISAGIRRSKLDRAHE